jgi:hypothetical protein
MPVSRELLVAGEVRAVKVCRLVFRLAQLPVTSVFLVK